MIEWLYISTGLFLGWSLGANHAVNVFGSAVSSRMVRFRTAAIVAGVFAILGAVISGAGTTRTLTTLGAVNALAGCFTVALAVGLTVTWMTMIRLPVSTSQAVVGGIVGWNLFTGSPTDTYSLSRIVSTWLVGPLLSALFGFLAFKVVTALLRGRRLHILTLDAHTRTGLLVLGAVASYLLGANNIANVMGMFVPAVPFGDVSFNGLFTLSGTRMLFFLGGLAIAVGILTYGEQVMKTVGRDLYKITPLAGLVVVFAEVLVLFLFTSESLESFLLHAGLPTIPLVPLSSTQVVIGAVIGVGLAKGGRGINYSVLGKIAGGWAVAPVVAGLSCYIALFVVQNVFELEVVKTSSYVIDPGVRQELSRRGLDSRALATLDGKTIVGSAQFRQTLQRMHPWSEKEMVVLFDCADLDTLVVDTVQAFTQSEPLPLTPQQHQSLAALHGSIFEHRWELDQALVTADSSWGEPAGTSPRKQSAAFRQLRERLHEIFRVHPQLSVR
jgi:PiT family inorganic phosphate transporter